MSFAVQILVIADHGSDPADLHRYAAEGTADQLPGGAAAAASAASAAAAAAPVKVVKVVPRQFDAGRLMAPKQIPKEIANH